jgi:hypothetical protein
MTLNSVDIAIGSVVAVGFLGAAFAWQALKAGARRRPSTTQLEQQLDHIERLARNARELIRAAR